MTVRAPESSSEPMAFAPISRRVDRRDDGLPFEVFRSSSAGADESDEYPDWSVNYWGLTGT